MKYLGIGVAVAAMALGWAWWLHQREQPARQTAARYTVSGALPGIDDAMVRTPANPDPAMVRIIENPEGFTRPRR